ncbi:multidrug transport system ATPase and permease components IrtA [Candidatus Termititenax aidoneus]|uniref:Multidrug transport system ATPase and permease components IrtA n=1 Tax=Termititenax aidoneus TaxID=2218524 RepID=A0A388TDL5_TERA1|nr:multidrug transport system ATPase and permease components IrtA [Candidatus Termititenax aidoneus]
MPENKPRRTGMARLGELAFQKKALTISACILSVASVVVSFAPFVAIYYIIRELALHYADLTALDTAYLLKLGWLAGGSAAAAVLLNYAALMCSHWAAFTTLYKLKLDFTRHIAALSLGFHTGHSTGQLRKIVDENIEKLEGFIAHQLPDLAGSFAMPVMALVILFWFDWRLGLASFAPIVLAYFIQASGFGSKAAQEFIKKYQDALEELNNAAVEYVRGIAVVKAFNQTIFSFRKFYATIKNYGRFCLNYTLSFEKHMVLFMTVIGNVHIFLLPVIIWLAGSAADYTQFALSAVFYLIFSVSLATPFTKLMYVSQLGQQIADGIGRMDKILDERPLPETKTPLTADNYSVSFRNVTFAYNSGTQTAPAALTDVSFTARQGEVTALVGPSGGGKSTIAHLIPRFYDVQSGAVKIGGVDIRDMASEYLLSKVSFVFQEVFLFKQSIADNILIGNKNASRAEMIAAAKAAQCHEFIQKLPQGYDTVIGAKNIHLSGGERQRLVLARAVLKNAPILVLDEATAFADPENEHKIQLALEKLMQGKTVIIIAHRLSTVRGADKILALDKGRIVEEGTHEKLAAARGLYSRMWQQYTDALNWTLSSGARKERSDV